MTQAPNASRLARKHTARNKFADVPASDADRGSIVSFRIPASLKARMSDLKYGPYKIGLTDVVIRGIELALIELEQANGK